MKYDESFYFQQSSNFLLKHISVLIVKDCNIKNYLYIFRYESLHLN